MTEKTEWEIVDAPSPQNRQAPQDWMKSLLGSWWRWKIAGVVIAAGLALVLLVALAGMVIIAVTAGALALLGIGKIRQWLRRSNVVSPLRQGAGGRVVRRK